MTPTLPDNWSQYTFRPIPSYEADRNDDETPEPVKLIRSPGYTDLTRRIKQGDDDD
jgi:hypothetical protein